MPTHDQSRAPGQSGYHFDHVLIIVFENQDYADVIADPYFASLAERGALFTDFHGLFHPSYSNYLAMVSGHAFMSAFDSQRNLKELTIADRLGEAKLRWKNYAEGYPGPPCVTNSTFPNSRYARKHVPFMSFESARGQQECGNIVSDRVLLDDLARGLPNYMFYSPDLDHDGHDPTSDHPVGLIKASRWLERFLEPLLKDRRFTMRTLTIVTFDESAALLLPDDNHIYTVFLGEMVEPGIYSENYNHFNVLRTIEDNFDLGTLTENDACAKTIDDVWLPNPTGEPPVKSEDQVPPKGGGTSGVAAPPGSG